MSSMHFKPIASRPRSSLSIIDEEQIQDEITSLREEVQSSALMDTVQLLVCLLYTSQRFQDRDFIHISSNTLGTPIIIIRD